MADLSIRNPDEKPDFVDQPCRRVILLEIFAGKKPVWCKIAKPVRGWPEGLVAELIVGIKEKRALDILGHVDRPKLGVGDPVVNRQRGVIAAITDDEEGAEPHSAAHEFP